MLEPFTQQIPLPVKQKPLVSNSGFIASRGRPEQLPSVAASLTVSVMAFIGLPIPYIFKVKSWAPKEGLVL